MHQLWADSQSKSDEQVSCRKWYWVCYASASTCNTTGWKHGCQASVSIVLIACSRFRELKSTWSPCCSQRHPAAHIMWLCTTCTTSKHAPVPRSTRFTFSPSCKRDPPTAVVLPTPSWPFALSPQQATFPPSTRAQLWLAPETTEAATSAGSQTEKRGNGPQEPVQQVCELCSIDGSRYQTSEWQGVTKISSGTSSPRFSRLHYDGSTSSDSLWQGVPLTRRRLPGFWLL